MKQNCALYQLWVLSKMSMVNHKRYRKKYWGEAYRKIPLLRRMSVDHKAAIRYTNIHHRDLLCLRKTWWWATIHACHALLPLRKTILESQSWRHHNDQFTFKVGPVFNSLFFQCLPLFPSLNMSQTHYICAPFVLLSMWTSREFSTLKLW